MFEIEDFTEVRLASVTNRIEKHGDEDVPAVSLSIEFTTANTLLDSIDAGLRHALYKAKPDAEPELPGVEQSTPVLRCNSIEKVVLTTAHEGWRLFVDDNIDAEDPAEFGGVKVDKIAVDAKQGGSVTLKLRLGTSDVDADRLGMLAVHNGQSIWLKLLKPEKAPAAIDGSAAAFEKDHPGAAAGQGSLLDDGAPAADDGLGTFADDMARGAGPDDQQDRDDGEGSSPDAASEQPTGEPNRGPGWPFPLEGKAADGATPPDSGAAEQAELEAGMRESMSAAGLAPKGSRRGRKTAAVE